LTRDDIATAVQAAAMRLAEIPPGDDGAASSLDHCDAQCTYWRLMTALESTKPDPDMSRLRLASQQGQEWEQRRQRALAARKADDLAYCRKILDEMLSQGPVFEALDE
jgi:hypothetical protein